jgi:hypothetical protein
VVDRWVPPEDSIGVVDLFAELQLADTTIAHRWPIHLGSAAANPAVAAPTPAIEARRVAVRRRASRLASGWRGSRRPRGLTSRMEAFHRGCLHHVFRVSSPVMVLA